MPRKIVYCIAYIVVPSEFPYPVSVILTMFLNSAAFWLGKTNAVGAETYMRVLCNKFAVPINGDANGGHELAPGGDAELWVAIVLAIFAKEAYRLPAMAVR